MDAHDIADVLRHYELPPVHVVQKLGNGQINDTYLVECGSERFVLQQLHIIFSPLLTEDFDAVTHHLRLTNSHYPHLIKSKEDTLTVERNQATWRLMTYVPGTSVEANPSYEQAYSAAKLLGEFHFSLSSFAYKPKAHLPYFHDTPYVIDKLSEVLHTYAHTPKVNSIKPLADEVLLKYQALSIPTDLPKRLIHADPKLNNVRFDLDGNRALCFLDLDTVMEHWLLIDFGDAVRSWCNKADEDFPQDAEFETNTYQAINEGYREGIHDLLTETEERSLSLGFLLIALELCARYLTDAVEEYYFKLNTHKYGSLFEQNRVKAQTQLNLIRSFEKK
jgi:Ser/Thr protein kinase RdoA (MazF antagonist)